MQTFKANKFWLNALFGSALLVTTNPITAHAQVEYNLQNISALCGRGSAVDLNDQGNVLFKRTLDHAKAVAMFDGQSCIQLPLSAEHPNRPGFNPKYGFDHRAYDFNNQNQLVGEHIKTVIADPKTGKFWSRSTPFGASFKDGHAGRYVDLDGLMAPVRQAVRKQYGLNVTSIWNTKINDSIRIAGNVDFGYAESGVFSLKAGKVTIFRPLPGFDYLSAGTLNANDQIVALMTRYEVINKDLPATQYHQPVLLNPDGSIVIAELPSGFLSVHFELGLNDRGDVVGTLMTHPDYTSASLQIAVWRNENGKLIPQLLGQAHQYSYGSSTAGVAINNCGDVVGRENGIGKIWRQAAGEGIVLRNLIFAVAALPITPLRINNRAQILVSTLDSVNGQQFQLMSPLVSVSCPSEKRVEAANIGISRKGVLGKFAKKSLKKAPKSKAQHKKNSK